MTCDVIFYAVCAAFAVLVLVAVVMGARRGVRSPWDVVSDDRRRQELERRHRDWRRP